MYNYVEMGETCLIVAGDCASIEIAKEAMGWVGFTRVLPNEIEHKDVKTIWAWAGWLQLMCMDYKLGLGKIVRMGQYNS